MPCEAPWILKFYLPDVPVEEGKIDGAWDTLICRPVVWDLLQVEGLEETNAEESEISDRQFSDPIIPPLTPAPERARRTTWKDFIRSHTSVLAATDFFTSEVWTSRGFITY